MSNIRNSRINVNGTRPGGAPIVATGPRLVSDDDYLDFAAADRRIEEGLAHLNTKHAVVMLAGQARVAMEETRDVTFVRFEDFLKWYSNKKVATGTKKAGPNKGEDFIESWGALWLVWQKSAETPGRREYARVEFRPDLSKAQSEEAGVYNLFSGFAYEPSARESCQLFKDHWLNNICAGNKAHFLYQFAWFARIFQQPAAHKRPGVNLAFKSRAKGNGKSLIVDSIGKLLGPKYYTVARDAETITGQFNAHLERCLLLHAEEALWAGNRADQGILNSLTTNENLNIQRKGVDRYNAKNHINICVTSNEDWIVPASTDERRWAVFEVPMHEFTQKDDYFGAIVRELDQGGYARLLHELLTFDLTQVNLRKPPQTAALADQKLLSLRPVDAWLLDIAHNDRFLDNEGKTLSFGDAAFYRDAVYAAVGAFCKRNRKHAPIDSVIGRQLTETLGADLGKARSMYFLPPASTILDRMAAKLKITRKELDALLNDEPLHEMVSTDAVGHVCDAPEPEQEIPSVVPAVQSASVHAVPTIPAKPTYRVVPYEGIDSYTLISDDGAPTRPGGAPIVRR